MEGQLDTIIILDLPDGALDSILSVLCSSAIDDKLFYQVYSITRQEEPKEWTNIMNFRLVCKSFQKMTDRVVPSFALYQQLFNKGVDPSVWITKQEEELTARFKGFVTNTANFQENGKACNPLVLPDLSSVPLFTLESIINMKIHELLTSNASLKSIIKIAYAFPNYNTVGFTLTLPNSTLHPGKQLAFQVTNQSGWDHREEHRLNNRAILVQVNDSSLAEVLGITPSKTNLVLNEATSYYSGSTNGEYFANLAFFKNLSYIMPVYSAHEWIRNLLQASNAIQQNLPYSSDDKPVDPAMMGIETPFNASEDMPDELIADEWNRRTDPSIFDCSLPIFSNQIHSHSSQLQRLPLLPGSVVNQILFPSNNSLQHLLMTNKVIQFYRLNIAHKKAILSHFLSTQPHPGYQTTIKQIFSYLTINQKYSLNDPYGHSVNESSIHLGAVHDNFKGCYLIIKGDIKKISISTSNEKSKKKVIAYFGSCYLNGQSLDPTTILATLRLQKLFGVAFILPPIDIFAIFHALVDEPIEREPECYKIEERKQYPKLQIPYDSSLVDPSCSLENVQVHEENGVHLTSILINSSPEKYFYVVLQVLRNDSNQSWCHLRFGYKKELFSSAENETNQFHFKKTIQFQNTVASAQHYDYWISRLTDPKCKDFVQAVNKDKNKTADKCHNFKMLSVQEENALAFEIFYAERLQSKLHKIHTLLQTNQLEAIDQIERLLALLLTNVKVKCYYANMLAQSSGSFDAIKFLNLELQKRPFNGELWLTKAKILERSRYYVEAIRCYALFWDFPTEPYISSTKNPLYLKACGKIFMLFKHLHMQTLAFRVWELSPGASHTLMKHPDPEMERRMMIMKAKKYIRGTFHHRSDLDQGLRILISLKKQSSETALLVLEARFLLGKTAFYFANDQHATGTHEAMLQKLDTLFTNHQHIDLLIHKAVFLHHLSRFDQAIECYQKAASMNPQPPNFDIEAAIDAANNQKLIPWPFKVDFPQEVKIWTDEQIIMLFILHPNAVSSAREKVKLSNDSQTCAMQYLLNELDTAQAQVDNERIYFAHIYPVDQMFKKLFNDIPLKSIESITIAEPELSKAIARDSYYSCDMTLPFLFQLWPKSKHNTTLLWYPTHPCTIPYLLLHGISPDENGAKFHPKLSCCTHHQYYQDTYGIELSATGRSFCFSMALLVEVDSVAAEQNTVHERPKNAPQDVSWKKFPMTTIHNKSHIGAIRYLAVIIGTRGSWKSKICLVGHPGSLFYNHNK